MTYAILGVTGQVGGATARSLLARHQNVRAVTRAAGAASAWASQGADVASADLADADALTRAFTGVDGVFVMTPPGLDVPDPFAANHAALAALVHAVVAADVKHLVYLSSIGAQHATGLGAIGKLHDLEAAFKTLPIPSVAIRAGWFIENYRSLIAPAERSGTLQSMLDPLDLAVPMVATADIGEVAADLLRRGPNGKRVVELAYPRDYSSNDVARAIGSALGRTITPVPVPRSGRSDVYRSWGMSNAGAAAMSAMIDGFNSGWIAFEGGGAERRHAGTSLETTVASMTAPELRTRLPAG